MNFFMEIAKMRAARFMWSEIVKKFNPKILEAWLYVHIVKHQEFL